MSAPLPDMTVEELKQRLDNGERIVVLDVREPGEFAIANIGGRLIPMKELPARMSELDPEQHIVVHCHHGGRSAMATEFLRQQGFEHVQNLAGGIDAWSLRIDPKVKRY